MSHVCRHDHAALRELQSLSLSYKVFESRQRIAEWVQHWGADKCYIAFSGGKDSTVLLDLVRRGHPEIPAVFSNTGLEFPEIVQYVRTVPGVTWLKPKRKFKDVIQRWGYPFPSKEQAVAISRYRNTSDPVQKEYRLNGFPNGPKGKIFAKWKFLLDAPFKVSDFCCRELKKNPIYRYQRESGRPYGFVGGKADESNQRLRVYLKEGCNGFSASNPQSRPLSFWRDEDIWEYIRLRKLPYSSIYDKGYTRTGCVFCMFGVHTEGENNRFVQLSKTHPKLHRYCMNKLGIRTVLEYANLPTGCKEGGAE